VSAPRTTYRLAFTRPQAHLVDVEARFAAVGPRESLDLRMAAWTPGSYLVRDYARHVQDLTAEDEAGRPLAVGKLDKATWRVTVGSAQDVIVRYRVYGWELTVRTNHIDPSHAFLNGAPTFLWVDERRDEPAAVEVEPPAGWRFTTGLTGGPTRWIASDLDELIDSPFLGTAGAVHEVEAAGKPLVMAVHGRPDAGVASVEQLLTDTRTIVEAYASLFGGLPYDRYAFLLMLFPEAYGGLEHERSSALLSSPFAFSTRKKYEELLELVSHEYFHLWNVKRIRPKQLGPFVYDREAYTRALWVCEGLTSYYDRYTLRRARLQSPKRYLEKLADEWGKLLAIPGRFKQSIEESSFDAWIKLYQPHESSVNTSISYYLKGGLVSLALDFEIRRRTEGARSLDDVLLRLWTEHGARGLPYPEDVQPVFEAAAGIGLGEFFDRFVRGTEDPDLAAELREAGLELKLGWEPGQTADGATPVWLGATLEEGRVALATVLAGGPADAAGLAPGDEILAVDRRRVRSDAELRERLSARRPGQRADILLARHGRIVDLAVDLAEAPRTRCEIVGMAAPTDAQKQLYQRWLGAEHPGAGLSVSYNHAKQI
jgi:predicted metalloprotease with PDZ domain